MDKIVFLYGSGRDASTRAARRSVFPRETQIRLGPWTIRPARRVAVEFTRLLPYSEELLEKILHGVIQVQRADTAVISAEELRTAILGAPSMAAPPTPPPAAPSQAANSPSHDSEPSEATPVVEAPVEEPTEEPAPAEAPRREAPENWRELTAKELLAFCGEKGIPTTKTTQRALTAAIEAWLGGE